VPEVRAQIIVSAKDEASANLKKAGAAGKDALKDINKGAADALQSLTGLNIGSLGAAAAIGGLAVGLKYAVEQAAEAEKIMAVTEAVVKSTGMAAGLTADQIANMAGNQSQLNAVDDEVIQSGANLLLTFKKVKSDAFEPAMQAALDMSVVMGTDLRGSVMMVGKALEDPIRGITALRRAGVSFTVEQQATIKALVETGRAAEAQQMILAELNSQVGGAGVAAAKTYAGQMSLLKINMDNLAQAVGERLLPTLTKATEALNLLITADQKIKNAVAEHGQEVGKTSNTYEAYVDELKRAAVAAGMMVDEEGNLVELNMANYGVTNKLVQANYVLTKTQYEAAQSMVTFADVTDRAAERMDGATAAAGAYDTMIGQAIQNTNDYTAAQKRAAEAVAEAERANARLSAGLSGELQQASEDYHAVLAETRPEIAKLTADLARYNAANGQTFSVVTEAKHSLEEYELAQIKAAEAALKLNEFTGDSREEFLELKIAAANAAERVSNMGSEMGITQQFTADYTQKIIETTGSLEELRAKQAEAEAQLKLTTAQFLFQQAAADLDKDAALALARAMGLIDEASYNATAAMQELTKQYQTTGDLDEYTRKATILRDVIAGFQSRDITVTTTFIENVVERRYQNEIRSEAARQEEDYYNDAPGGPAVRAHGGPVWAGQSYLVGERGPEMFTPASAGTVTANGDMGGSEELIAVLLDLPRAVGRAVRENLALVR
jgi:hypothetical protein